MLERQAPSSKCLAFTTTHMTAIGAGNSAALPNRKTSCQLRAQRHPQLASRVAQG